MLKTPGSNNLVKKVFSIEGLVFLVALVALGLSIAAMVKDCKDGFGDTLKCCDDNKPIKYSCYNYEGDTVKTPVTTTWPNSCITKQVKGICGKYNNNIDELSVFKVGDSCDKVFCSEGEYYIAGVDSQSGTPYVQVTEPNASRCTRV